MCDSDKEISFWLVVETEENKRNHTFWIGIKRNKYKRLTLGDHIFSDQKIFRNFLTL